MKWSLLIVDDEPAQLNILSRFFESKKYIVYQASSSKDAFDKAQLYSPDIIITDFAMPDGSGLQLVKEVKKILPLISAIIVTAYGTIKTAVEAIKEGVDNFVEKPVNLELMEAMVKNILNVKKISIERDVLKNSAVDPSPSLLGNDQKIKKISHIIQTVAPLDASVLITGPTGCGKEVAAAAVWRQSDRGGRIYLKINCASIPETLFESELFGHEKGAFTGAAEKKAGIIETANGGTLLMDEIGDLPLGVQPKLLRFLESREYYKVGSSKPQKSDIRIIFATKTDLLEAVRQNKFREDLYFRINVVNIEIPPLRERKGDIPLIFGHFLDVISKKIGRDTPQIDKELKQAIIDYPWPGNIRELINAVERALIFSQSNILTAADFNLSNSRLRPDTQSENIFNYFGAGLNGAVAKLEKIYITAALSSSKNQTEAALMLGISERVLRYKMKILEIKA
jgi:DNA-binding NtrC family response regulator